MAARRAFLSRAYRPGKKIKPSTFLILIASPAFARFQGRPLALRLAIPGRAGALLRPAVAEVPQREFENFGRQNPFSHHHWTRLASQTDDARIELADFNSIVTRCIVGAYD